MSDDLKTMSSRIDRIADAVELLQRTQPHSDGLGAKAMRDLAEQSSEMRAELRSLRSEMSKQDAKVTALVKDKIAKAGTELAGIIAEQLGTQLKDGRVRVKTEVDQALAEQRRDILTAEDAAARASRSIESAAEIAAGAIKHYCSMVQSGR